MARFAKSINTRHNHSRLFQLKKMNSFKAVQTSRNDSIFERTEPLLQTCKKKEHKILRRTVSQYKKHFQVKTLEEKDDEVPYDAMAYTCLAVYILFVIFIAVVDSCFE